MQNEKFPKAQKKVFCSSDWFASGSFRNRWFLNETLKSVTDSSEEVVSFKFVFSQNRDKSSATNVTADFAQNTFNNWKWFQRSFYFNERTDDAT